MFWGSILTVAGVIWLLQNLGLIPGNLWDFFWPVVLIAWGLSVLTRKGGRWCGPFCCGPHDWHEKHHRKDKK